MLSFQEAKSRFIALTGKDRFEKMMYSAAILTDLLAQVDIKPIVVGGLSVEIYTLNGYTTSDVDFVLSGYAQASDTLTKLGFERIGKDWIHPTVGVSVEIPAGHLAGDPAKVAKMPVDDLYVYVIGIEDIILDRLRSAVHWQSGQDREWGYRLLLLYREKIDLPYIRSQCQDPKEVVELEEWLASIPD